MAAIRLWITLSGLTLAALLSYSQTGNGVVRGAITDASGSVVPNARVSLQNVATNIVGESASSTEGLYYYFADVRPGNYSISVESAGFKRWVGTFVLQAGQIANMFNHPNNVNPNGGTGLVDLSRQSNEPRIVQFSLRFTL